MDQPKFQIPNCAECPDRANVGPAGYETPYCRGFPGKKQRRLPKAGLKKSIAPWCPKRISPPRCNILGFLDDDQAMLEFMMHCDILAQGKDVAFPIEWRYKQRCIVPLNLKASAFWDEVHISPLTVLFPDITFTFGEVVEIDDGFKPYYFYYAGEGKFLPAPVFDGSKVKR